MKHIFSAVFCLVFSFHLFLTSCHPHDSLQSGTTDTVKVMTSSEMISRGKYLVTYGGCNHCHTPKKFTPQGPELDSAWLLAGYKASNPLPPLDKKSLQPGSWILFSPDRTAALGPWGISFGVNLTPDTATGIGSWTEDDFIHTIRRGKHLGQEGGHPILPPMPWQDIALLNDQDLKSIFAFLKAIPPVSNKVPQDKTPEEVLKMHE